jgi:aerobic carbon-monoxide dehydrogenase large subunit
MEPFRHIRNLVTGQGTYVADVQLPDQLHAVVVRSPVANGYVRGIDTDEATNMPGVRAVIVAADLGTRVPLLPMRLSARAEFARFLQPVLAADRVRYVGEPIALVVADNQYLAEDAAEYVQPNIENLPAVLYAAGLDEPQGVETPLFPETDSNVVCKLRGAFGDVDAAFRDADVVVSHRFNVGRHSAVPMETRGLVATWVTGALEVWGATKAVHVNRRLLSGMFDVPEESIRFHATDVGGGFGVRGELYPEDFLVPWAARMLGRPVKWIEDRREHLMATNHSRQQWHETSVALTGDGRLLAMHDHFCCDMGAYIRAVGARVPELTIASMPGPYRWQAYQATCDCLMSNKTPTGTMRSPGRLEATFVRERLVDLAAREIGMDPIELRARNLLTGDDMPFSIDLGPNTLGVYYDSGDYAGVWRETIERAGYDETRERFAEARRQGRRVGVGAVPFTEKTGVGPAEAAAISVREDGTFLIQSGTARLGQGVEPTLAAIAAEALRVSPELITVQCGDTASTPASLGSFGSRSTIFAGSAVLEACCTLLETGNQLAAKLAQTVPAGHGQLFGSGGRLDWCDLLRRSGQKELRAEGVFEQTAGAMAFGVVVAEVEVDPGTGGVTVTRLVIGYDVGRAISRDRVAAQLIGGAVHGLGGALWEEFTYDNAGQPQNVSFMDYLLPTCAETPAIETHVLEWSKAIDNPLGVKGAGEGGVPGVPAAIAAAVDDALALDRVPVAALPITPDVIRSMIEQNEAAECE